MEGCGLFGQNWMKLSNDEVERTGFRLGDGDL